MYFSLKYITANVSNFECGRFCNSKAPAVVGKILAMRTKLDKGFKNHTKIWSHLNALKNHGDLYKHKNF
ncbi:hypothetical protein AMTRI_Chr02g211900 [Amborella trichopoda]